MRDRLSTKDYAGLLQDGVETWNVFRREHPDFLILNCARLPEAQLAHIDLHRVLLMGSDFRRANLDCAILERSVLRNSDFRESNLRRANLDGADLCRADLSGADLRDASLVSAFLKRADLTGADLSSAHGLTDAQLRDAIGDESTKLPENLARPEGWRRLKRAVGAPG